MRAPDRQHHYGRVNNGDRSFLPTVQVCEGIREALHPRFQFRPYVFRAFFDTELLIAESRGKIAHDFRVFFMGHKGSIEAKYTTNKGILPRALIDEMRESFKRCEEYLDLEVSREDPLEKKREDMKSSIERLSSDQLGKVQAMLSSLGVCNTSPGSVS